MAPLSYLLHLFLKELKSLLPKRLHCILHYILPISHVLLPPPVREGMLDDHSLAPNVCVFSPPLPPPSSLYVRHKDEGDLSAALLELEFLSFFFRFSADDDDETGRRARRDRSLTAASSTARFSSGRFSFFSRNNNLGVSVFSLTLVGAKTLNNANGVYSVCSVCSVCSFSVSLCVFSSRNLFLPPPSSSLSLCPFSPEESRAVKSTI